jgi:signal transduction histidine kinase
VAPASWSGNTGLLVIGIALALALLAVAVVQGRQFSLLTETVRSGDENVALTVYRTETEYLRLREQWARAVDDRQPLDAAALQLRYDIWVSRVGLIREGSLREPMSRQPGVAALVGQFDDFIAKADRLLGPQPAAMPDRRALAALQPALEALGLGIHDVTLNATHQAAEDRSQRDAAVRRHNQVGIGLTLFLSALTLAFALLALRQLRHADERGRALEELTVRLQAARREAEEASAAKSTFLANMSHEIRTPFQGLMGMLSLLRETGLTARQVDYLRTATESADHLLAILNDILDLSQLENGRMTLAPAPVDLRVLLRDVEALMRPQANAKALALHIGADPAVPERVMADATRVKQVLFNLLSNAIKFSERGAVALDVRQVHGADDGAAIEFVVTDTGVGIDAQALDGLFRRFAPGDSSRSRRHAGAGLGLEISRNLARLMGGDITVTSQPGKGSRFVFQAPLPAVAALPAASVLSR